MQDLPSSSSSASSPQQPARRGALPFPRRPSCPSLAGDRAPATCARLPSGAWLHRFGQKEGVPQPGRSRAPYPSRQPPARPSSACAPFTTASGGSIPSVRSSLSTDEAISAVGQRRRRKDLGGPPTRRPVAAGLAGEEGRRRTTFATDGKRCGRSAGGLGHTAILAPREPLPSLGIGSPGGRTTSLVGPGGPCAFLVRPRGRARCELRHPALPDDRPGSCPGLRRERPAARLRALAPWDRNQRATRVLPPQGPSQWTGSTGGLPMRGARVALRSFGRRELPSLPRRTSRPPGPRHLYFAGVRVVSVGRSSFLLIWPRWRLISRTM